MNVEQALQQLSDAIARDDAEAGRTAVVKLAGIVLGDIQRIANAIEHIARNTPDKPAT